MMIEPNIPPFIIPQLPMTIDTIRQYLPHRYPFLMVDRVTDIGADQITGYKNVTINEEYFQGHFPETPIMPGVMIIEAMAQLSGILGFLINQHQPGDGTLFLFAGAEKIRFRKPVVAGDQLQLHAQLVAFKRNLFKYNCQASVAGELVSSAEIMISHRVKELA